MATQAVSSPSAPWCFPGWLEARLLPDARFARAYAQFGDAERALLKRVIASHYVLSPPRLAKTRDTMVVQPASLCARTLERPLDYVLLLVDESLDAPALLLSALMPALTSGVGQVLLARLGAAASIPASLLTACELAGQERFAVLGPVQAERLLLECAGAHAEGLLLYAASNAVLRVLNRPGLRGPLLGGALRAVPLDPPKSAGLWRDTPDQFPQDALRFLYGNIVFDEGGCGPGQTGPARLMDTEWQAFAQARRDLLLAPDTRECHANGARVVVSEAQLGLWKWSRLTSELFIQAYFAFTTAC